MRNNPWVLWLVLGVMVAAYFVGEATGLLFFAMLIILPLWVWLLFPKE